MSVMMQGYPTSGHVSSMNRNILPWVHVSVHEIPTGFIRSFLPDHKICSTLMNGIHGKESTITVLKEAEADISGMITA